MSFIPVCEPLLAGNELKYVTEAVSSGWISSAGSYVTAFEEAFAEYCNAEYAIATTSGTTALHLALVALGIGPEDEVIIPDFTMIASAYAVCYTGATPVFADSDPFTWNICPDAIAQAITPNTKAIMPVHVFGNPCDMDSLRKLAAAHNICIVEDAAEAHGAEYKGRKVGTLGDIAAFSFFGNKNLTTGEGGMVVTNSKEAAEKARYYKNMCFPIDSPREYLHHDIGFNYRMSNLHAAIGLAQTEKADTYRAMRMRNGNLYRELLQDIPGIQLQKIQTDGTCVHWMNGICLEPQLFGRNRDELVQLLRKQGIDTRLFFKGMHEQPCLCKYHTDCSQKYPVSTNLAQNGFYLPSASSLTKENIAFICDTLIRFRK